MGGQTTTSYRRDPVSELLDPGARDLLRRAFAARGQWVSTRLADPGARLISWAAGIGIDLTGPDEAPTDSGRRNDAHTRYGRAFIRALYYNHRWYTGTRGLRATRRLSPWSGQGLQVEWGRRRPALGVIPAGREIRVRTRPGGAASQRARDAMPDERRIYTGTGGHGGRSSTVEGRDWQ